MSTGSESKFLDYFMSKFPPDIRESFEILL